MKTAFFIILMIFVSCRRGVGEAALPCGQRLILPSRRIVNGNNVVIQEWPWMVGLMLNGDLVCGGSLVAPDTVVTAAHCLIDSDVSHWKAILGQDQVDGAKTTDIVSFIKHPLFRYNGPTFERPCEYDIALLKLSINTSLSTSTFPICLLPKNAPFVLKRNCHVTGWGRSSKQGSQSNTLQEITVDLVPKDVCNSNISYNGVIHDSAICAGPEAGGRGPCQFDSGGPLTCEDRGAWYLTGIVSFGIGCAIPHKYGVYSNMFLLTSWVEEQLSGLL